MRKVALVCVTWLALGTALEKPFINLGGFICPRQEKALGRCLRDALNAYIPMLATGLPQFGIPSCEPLAVPPLTLRQASGAFHVNTTYSDVTVRGPSAMKIRSVDVNPQQHSVTAQLFIPRLRVRGRYRAAGRALLLPVDAAGRFDGEYENIDATLVVRLGRAPRPSSPRDALACRGLDVSFRIGDASMDIENNFGEGELGKAMGKYLNENWRVLVEELQAPLEHALRDFLQPLAARAFATLDADDILSD